MASVGKKNGPTERDVVRLNQWKEKGCTCGNKCSKGFIMKRQLRCRDLIETQYYNSELIMGKPTRGRIATKAIGCLCCDEYDIVSRNEIKKTQDVGGGNPIPICRK
eukprot:5459701-Ditylum_brightwellii.AAC.1